MSDFRTLEKNPTISILFDSIAEYKPEYQKVLHHCEKTTDGFCKFSGFVAVWWGRIGTNNTYRHVFYSDSGVVIGSFDHPGIIVSGEEIDPKRLRRQIEDKIRKEFDMRIGMLIGMGSELNIL